MTNHAPLYLDLLERGAIQNADRIAVVCGEEMLTFAEVNARANRYGRALHAVGARPAARVALLINNSISSIPIDFACAKAGLNRVPLNGRLSFEEHVRMVREADCRFLIYDAELAERARQLKSAVDGLEAYGLGVGDQGRNLDSLAALQPPERPDYQPQPSDYVLTLYTSGTTGVLKAAQHTQATFAAVCRNVLLNLFPARPDDVMLHAASLIHASGAFVMPLWIRGGCSVVLPGFAPASYLAAIQRHRVTAINLVPTMMQMLLEAPELDTHDVSSLERIIYGASPMPRAIITKAIARFGQQRFWQYFGQTEAPLCLAVLRPEDHVDDLLGACGMPAIDVELRLVGEEGGDVEPGQAGEIWVRGDNVARGYFRAETLSGETFDADGWVHTRDVGVLDERGFLHLRDRTSDMIISGGYNVYPREVEDALMSHPAVASAAVVGAPNDKWVEAIVAFVVLRSEALVEAAELIAHVSQSIASYKKPYRIEFCDALPKTAVGKLDRRTLRAAAAARELGR